jgi:hypothetical protein
LHLRYGVLFWGGDECKKLFKLQKKVVRLTSNAGRDTSCRILFKTLSIPPLPCACMMQIEYCIKMNIGRLQQNSGIIIILVLDQIFSPTSLGLIFVKKKSVNNME